MVRPRRDQVKRFLERMRVYFGMAEKCFLRTLLREGSKYFFRTFLCDRAKSLSQTFWVKNRSAFCRLLVWRIEVLFEWGSKYFLSEESKCFLSGVRSDSWVEDRLESKYFLSGGRRVFWGLFWATERNTFGLNNEMIFYLQNEVLFEWWREILFQNAFGGTEIPQI